ncbi:unnamed protein product [Blepharisma stoltei]|uniref:Palmitoyltransferase n=1 Tax=Blepharisma stoltei TaxID=1481888 RepID=A0AAU9JVZ0_9CILI|nr:unnamed protein product [Blepharisma stoltei]
MLFHKNYALRVLYGIPALAFFIVVALLYLSFYSSFISSEKLSIPLIFLYTIFHFDLVLILWSYIRVVATDPGTIPEYFDFLPNNTTEGLTTDHIEADVYAAKIGMCNKCHQSRPPRTHHCSICDRCILRMDHHCPWVGNCIGFFNHKYFIQFLVYTSIDLLILGTSSGIKLYYSDEDLSICLLLSTIVGISMFFSLICLSLFHIWLIATNQSSLEVRIGGFNVFDTGSKMNNFKQIFGSNIISVLLPISSASVGNGVYYPVKIRRKAGGIDFYDEKIFI